MLLTAVRANPRRTKNVSVVAVCSGIGIPPRVEAVLDDAEQVLENVSESSSRDAKSVDVFDNDVTGISPVL